MQAISHRKPLLLLIFSAVLLCVTKDVCPTVGDDRFAMSGWAGWSKFDEVGSCWWLNWGKSLGPTYANDNYPYVRMYWRTKAGEYTDETIQN